jgi:uncharacterized coiled-coil protein SlyX
MSGVTNLYDFMIDAIQSGYISELNNKIEDQQKEIDELKANVERLAQWVLFLATNGKEIQNADDNRTTDGSA